MAHKAPGHALSDRDKLWAEYYIGPGCFNVSATSRYLGMTRKQGHALRQKVTVRDYIEVLCQRMSDRYALSSQRWVGEVLSLALSDPTELFNDDGSALTVKDLKRLPPQIRAAIKEITTRADGTCTVKMHPKEGPLRLLGEYMHVLKSRGMSPAGDPPPTGDDEEDGVLMGLVMVGPGHTLIEGKPTKEGSNDDE